MAVNFELLVSMTGLERRDFELADETLINPYGANPLLDGEWLELDTNGKLARGAGEGSSALVFPIFSERGRYDVTAIKKVTTIMLGQYEAETSIVNTAGLVVGDALSVQMVTIGGVANKRGLAEATIAGVGVTRAVVGHVSKVMGSKIRFIHTANVQVKTTS